MDVFDLVSVWFFAVVGAALSGLSLARATEGRAVIFARRVKWSIGEATFAGYSSAFGGLVLSCYGLVGVIGHGPWTYIVQTAMGLVVLTSVLLPPAVLEQRQNHRWPYKHQREVRRPS